MSRACVWTCCVGASRGARNPWTWTRPSRSWAASTGSTQSTRRCWPFDEIAPIVGRSPTAARRAAATVPDAELTRQRQVVDAFLAASRAGDFDALVAVLDPDVVVRADAVPPGTPSEVHGARIWARQAIAFTRGAQFARPALVNGAVGAVLAPGGRLFRALSFTLADGKIAQIEVVADPARLRQLDLAILDDFPAHARTASGESDD